MEFVSVIIPCRNEVIFIGKCLDSIVGNDYPKDRLEVLVVDGMSEDGTRRIVADYAWRYAFIRVIDNAKKTTPAALNAGIRNAKGEIIMRMDGHTVYPPNYISGLTAWLKKTGADNVGGIWVTCAANDTPIAQAIAVGLSHPFGVGNGYFRIGASEPRWVDTVPFGCYRKEVFHRIGLFDEELVRNQDDEFNLRLIKQGGRILLVPEIFSHYYARESLLKVWRMYYQYGYFKPLVIRKIGSVMTMRHMIPAVFVLSLLATGMLGLWFPTIGKILGAIVLAYAAGAATCATIVGFKRGVRCALALCVVFPVLHVSFGLGFLKGVLDFVICGRKWTTDVAEIPISR